MEWKDISGYRTGIAEETLDRVSLCLLLLVYHIAYQHLERLQVLMVDDLSDCSFLSAIVS